MPRVAASGRFLQRDSGTAIALPTGANCHITLPNVTASITTAFTLSAWVKRAHHSVRGNIFRSGSADRLWFNFQDTNKLRIYLSEGSINSTESTNSVGKDFDWHFAVATWDGATVKIYYNNVLVGSQAVTGTINFAGGGIFVGNGASTDSYKGIIDEPTVYSRALTTDELTALYYDNIVPSSGLITRFLLNEGSGSSATDASGNGNTGAIGAGATYTTIVPFKPRNAATGRVTI